MVKWQKLCEKLHYYTFNQHHQFRNEDDFEAHFYDYLDLIFGWDSDFSKRQFPVQFGHQSKRLDVVLFHENRPSIIVELKKPGVALCGESSGQLSSYMTQLHAEFGILTNGIVFQLFYKPLDDRKPHASKVLSIRFDSDNKDGIELGKLLDHSNFDEQELKDFCEAKMDSIKEQTKNVPMAQQFVAEQMSEDLDRKILEMSILYKEWVSTNPKEENFINDRQKAIEWVEDNVLNLQKIRKMTDADFEKLMHEIPNYLTNLKFGANRTLYTHLNGRKDNFVRAIEHLCEATSEEKFIVIKDLLEDEAYKIKGVARSFWSEVIRCRFKDIPLVNAKTENFFNSIGIQIGFTEEEKVESVYYCYNRWGKLCKNMTVNDFSHMEHFAKVADSGISYMERNFGPQL